MKKAIVIALFSILWQVAGAQVIYLSSELNGIDSNLAKDVSYTVKNDKVWIDYVLKGTAHVDLYISLDGGKTYRGPLEYVTGSVGDDVQKGRNYILWDAQREFGDFASEQVVFRVVSLTKEDRVKLALQNKGKTGISTVDSNIRVGELRRYRGAIAVGKQKLSVEEFDQYVGSTVFHDEYLKAKRMRKWAWWSLAGGPIMMAAGMGLIATNEVEGIGIGVWGLGVAVTAIAPPTLLLISNKKLNRIVSDCKERENQQRQLLSFGPTNNGIGLTFSF
ncbi:MAG: hypothetical protein II841_12430 [Bacteroidales bacterium]|nr:hypothetical protein [Bacteroidales bacterium]